MGYTQFMARRPTEETPREKDWTPDSIRLAIRKLRRRIADVDAFDTNVVSRRDPRIEALRVSITETLAEVFGQGTGSFRRYESAASIDTARHNVNGVPQPEIVQGLVRGKQRALELLQGAVRMLTEKLEDDFGETLQGGGLQGVQATAVAAGQSGVFSGAPFGSGPFSGTARAAGPDPILRVGLLDEAWGGTISLDQIDGRATYEALESRLALLESSISELRRALSETSQHGGIGHNAGPAFAPVPVEDLAEIDTLIALLKDAGPTPPAEATPIIAQSEKVFAIGQKIQTSLVTLGTEIVKGAAREAGKEVLAAHWGAVAHWIEWAIQAVRAWLVP